MRMRDRPEKGNEPFALAYTLMFLDEQPGALGLGTDAFIRRYEAWHQKEMDRRSKKGEDNEDGG